MAIAIPKDASPQQVYTVLGHLVDVHEQAGIETISVKGLKEWLNQKKTK
jgi:hypothetical protein